MSLTSSLLTFFSMLLAMTFSCRSCWSISREMFRETSGVSTMPWTKLKWSGSRSGHFSIIITPEE